MNQTALQKFLKFCSFVLYVFSCDKLGNILLYFLLIVNIIFVLISLSSIILAFCLIHHWHFFQLYHCLLIYFNIYQNCSFRCLLQPLHSLNWKLVIIYLLFYHLFLTFLFCILRNVFLVIDFLNLRYYILYFFFDIQQIFHLCHQFCQSKYGFGWQDSLRQRMKSFLVQLN